MMISGTGINKPVTRAFTIVEVLLVLALIALIAGLFAVNFDTLLTTFSEKTPEKVLHEVVRESRLMAITNHQPVRLQWMEVDDSKQFTLYNNAGQRIATFPVDQDIEVRFSVFGPLVSQRGRFIASRERTRPIDFITFYPDSSSTPALLTVITEESEYLLRLDPMSCGLKFLNNDEV